MGLQWSIRVATDTICIDNWLSSFGQARFETKAKAEEALKLVGKDLVFKALS